MILWRIGISFNVTLSISGCRVGVKCRVCPIKRTLALFPKLTKNLVLAMFNLFTPAPPDPLRVLGCREAWQDLRSCDRRDWLSRWSRGPKTRFRLGTGNCAGTLALATAVLTAIHAHMRPLSAKDQMLRGCIFVCDWCQGVNSCMQSLF